MTDDEQLAHIAVARAAVKAATAPLPAGPAREPVRDAAAGLADDVTALIRELRGGHGTTSR